MTNKSRLKETAFSSYNLREAYINDQAEYVSAIRDEAIFSNYGIPVTVRVPIDEFGTINENNVDSYSNFVDTEWLTTTETVVPLFKEYRENVSEEGMAADGTDSIYPLSVLIPSKLHLPKNSRIILTEYNSKEERIAREWTVLGTVMKQITDSKTYCRTAHCVPAREGLFNTGEIYYGDIWFDMSTADIVKDIQTRSLGIIWFDMAKIDPNGVIIALDDSVTEDILIDQNTGENLTLLYYYDNRHSSILESGSGFRVDEEFDLIKNDREPLLIRNIDGTTSKLKIKILEVDVTGNIEAYEFIPKQAFSNIDNEEVTVYSNNGLPAILKVESIGWDGDNTEETLNKNVISNPKYISVYEMSASLVGKSIVISVLN